MQISNQVNQMSYHSFNKVRQTEGTKVEQQTQKTEIQSQKVETAKIAYAEKTESAKVNAKPKERDTVEISQSAMKLYTESAKQKNAQDKLTAEQVAQSAIASLQEKGNTLKELSSKHQEAKPEEKRIIESQAKDVVKDMNNVTEKATVNGKNVLAGKYEVNIPKDVEKVDMKEMLKPENVEQQVIKPLEEAKEKVDANVQNMVASLSASTSVTMTKTDAQTNLQTIKDSLKASDVKKISSALDSRRENVAHLLR